MTEQEHNWTLDRAGLKPMYGGDPPKELTWDEYERLIAGETVRGWTMDDGPFLLTPDSPARTP